VKQLRINQINKMISQPLPFVSAVAVKTKNNIKMKQWHGQLSDNTHFTHTSHIQHLKLHNCRVPISLCFNGNFQVDLG